MTRLYDTYPGEKGEIRSGRPSPELTEWREWARREQVSVIIDTFGSTMIERYRLERIGKKAGDYAQNKKNWDIQFLAVAGVVGGAFLYLNGVHAKTNLGPVTMALDMSAGRSVRKAIQDEKRLRRMAGVEIGWKDKPLTFHTEWGVDHGKVRNELYGAKYRKRF